LDFAEPNFEAALTRAQRRFGALLRSETDWQDALREWITQLLAVRLPSGASLAEVRPDQLLRETEFYFPMHGEMQHNTLSRVLAAHRGRSVGSLAIPAQLKGMMHGYIDLVYHWQGRYYVVDYKSTYLGNRLSDYGSEALTENVQQNYYDLQYLLYSLALHRYLKTRLPDYDPAQHLGGVEYLYLRGMHPDHSTGIYHCDTDLAALQALDDYFSGQERAA